MPVSTSVTHGCFAGQTTQPLDPWTVLGPYRGYVAPDVVHEHPKEHTHVTWKALEQLAREENLLDEEAGRDLLLLEYRYRNVRWPSAASPERAQSSLLASPLCF